MGIACLSPSQSAAVKRCKKLKNLIEDEELLYHAVFKKCLAELATEMELKVFRIATLRRVRAATRHGFKKCSESASKFQFLDAQRKSELDINAHSAPCRIQFAQIFGIFQAKCGESEVSKIAGSTIVRGSTEGEHLDF